SPTTSTIVADSATISADGGPTIVTVTVLDEFSNPIPNATVTLASDVVGDAITPPASATGANGVTTGIFDATASGAHVITASVGGVPIATGATVTVNAGALSPTVSTVEVSADTITASEGNEAS